MNYDIFFVVSSEDEVTSTSTNKYVTNSIVGASVFISCIIIMAIVILVITVVYKKRLKGSKICCSFMREIN